MDTCLHKSVRSGLHFIVCSLGDYICMYVWCFVILSVAAAERCYCFDNNVSEETVLGEQKVFVVL